MKLITIFLEIKKMFQFTNQKPKILHNRNLHNKTLREFILIQIAHN